MPSSTVRYKVREVHLPDEAMGEKLHAIAQVRQVRRARRRAGGALVFAALAAALVLGAIRFVPITSGSSARAVSQGNQASPLPSAEKSVEGPHRGTQTVSFRDGSKAQLQSEETELRVVTASNDLVQVELPRGSAHFVVSPDKSRRFVVRARDVVITVLGTEFSVKHEPSRTWVGVTHGRVMIGFEGAEKILTGGEASWFERSQEPDVVAPPSDGPASSPTPTMTRKEELARAREDFTLHHERAEYARAYEILAREREALGTDAEQLLRAADAARYSGHPHEAIGYLERVPKAHPLGPSARFTLGRLFLHELGNPQRAAEEFAEVRHLAPGGPLAEDALFREIEARAKSGEKSYARALATTYLSSYPNSSRRQSVLRYVEDE